MVASLLVMSGVVSLYNARHQHGGEHTWSKWYTMKARLERDVVYSRVRHELAEHKDAIDEVVEAFQSMLPDELNDAIRGDFELYFTVTKIMDVLSTIAVMRASSEEVDRIFGSDEDKSSKLDA